MTKAPRYFIQLPVETAKRIDINSTDKLVFGEIHTILNANKYFFMSSRKLGKKIGVNSRTIIRSIKKLNYLNYIDIKFNAHDPQNHKRYICHDRPLGPAQNVSTSDDKMSKGTTQNVTTGHVQNVTVEDKKRTLDKRVAKNTPQNIFEKEFTDIDKLVQQKWTTSIPNNKRMLMAKLIARFGYQQVKKAIDTTYDNGIGINGMPNYVKAVVFGNQNKPKRKNRTYSYGHQPIRQHIPKWAKDGYHEKLHPTSKKLQKKIQEQFHDLNNRGKK